MGLGQSVLKDNFGRVHDYLRISLTEKCNLRCTYCMPEEGLHNISPKESLMQADELYELAKIFSNLGVNKIRLTGGEPLIRKDFNQIIQRLASLPVQLAITTNAVFLDRHIDVLNQNGIKKINISLDSLKSDINFNITKRNHLSATLTNVNLAINQGFDVKVNCVLLKGVNCTEIIDFIELTRHKSIEVRFIEFMPFQGNGWQEQKIVSEKEILNNVNDFYGQEHVMTIQNSKNETSRNFSINGYKGSFGIISSVTNPFCEGCNRLRLTANGTMRNCLFSIEEQDLLGILRKGQDVESVIKKHLLLKHKTRNGMDDNALLGQSAQKSEARSMIRIGG